MIISLFVIYMQPEKLDMAILHEVFPTKFFTAIRNEKSYAICIPNNTYLFQSFTSNPYMALINILTKSLYYI